MSEAEHLSQAMTCFFSDPQNGWFHPLALAIQDLSAEQAATVPARGFNSVWAVVNHVRFCQELVMRRLGGNPESQKPIQPGEDWPPIGDPLDESAWQEASRCLLEANQLLAKAIAALPDEGLTQKVKPSGVEIWQLVQGVFSHNSYHTCEIISIRHMQGLWIQEV